MAINHAGYQLPDYYRLGGVLSDREIHERVQQNQLRISAYQNKKITHLGGDTERDKVLSYGLSEAGYTIRLSYDVMVSDPAYGAEHIVDPKRGRHTTKLVKPEWDRENEAFIIRPKTHGLASVVEKVTMPDNLYALPVGKSTYARVGLLAYFTGVEPGWDGYLTFEFYNASDQSVMLYPMEGICQLVFMKLGTKADTPYSGAYQNQKPEITFAGGNG
jgi:dCTP deaminase